MPSPRRPARRGGGVGVKHGKLYLDFRFRNVRCKEYVNDDDTPANRTKWEARVGLIKAQIAAGVFDYRAWFPNGTKLSVFYPAAAPVEDLTIEQWLRRWHERRSPFRPDGSLIDDAELHPSTWLHDGPVIDSRLIGPLGSIRLADFSAEQFEVWKRALHDDHLSGKTVLNYSGLLHKAMEDAVRAKLIAANPVPPLRTRRHRSGAPMRKNSQPLTAAEVRSFIAALPERIDLRDGATVDAAMLRDLYSFWFRTGWRPNEVMALRFEWVSAPRQTIEVRRGRMARGGHEAAPKDGTRAVICDYDPAIWKILERRRRESLRYGRPAYVFTDSLGRPLSQEQLAKRVWNPTIEAIGLSSRGQYNIRDTFITLALSAGEDPGWVAQVCGNSEQMLFEHYRTWMPTLRRGHGRHLVGLLGPGPKKGPEMGPERRRKASVQLRNQPVRGVEAGGIEPPSEGDSRQRLRA